MLKHPESITVGGTKYSLKHLWPKNITITLPLKDGYPEMEIPLLIFFSNHCVSEGAKIWEDHDMHDHNGNPRKFCETRYELSLGLIDILQDIALKKCIFNRANGWLIAEFTNRNGEAVKYHIYFTIQKHKTKKNGLAIWINSAHIKDRPDNALKRGKGTDRIRFVTLARKILAGEKPVRPNRQ